MLGLTKWKRQWAKDEGFSTHKGDKILAAGEVDVIAIMGRTHVVWQSWIDYLQRQQDGAERDPEVKAAAAANYRRITDEVLRRQGRELRRGSAKGRPNRPAETMPVGRSRRQAKTDLIEENPQTNR